jgi:prepilin-type N-terminal cleavage/methylation domain-containing protein
VKHYNIARRGFTLVELLVVIAIIGILSTIVYISVANVKQRSNYSRVLADMQQINGAARAYEAVSNVYPSNPVTVGTLPAELSPYLAGGWPTPPCKDYKYDFVNFTKVVNAGTTTCTGGATANSAAAGITYRNSSNALKFYLNIKGLSDCPSFVGVQDISTKDPKTITCNE